jgi:hypothetical protein
MTSADIAALEAPALPEAAAAARVPKAAGQRLWMNVIRNDYAGEAQAYDYNARIESRVRLISKDSYDVNTRADAGYNWASIRKWQDSYTFSGSGSYLTMNCSPGSCSISGNVRENGKTAYINAFVHRRFDDFSWDVSGSGLNIYTDRHSINGTYDPDTVPKSAVAGIVSLLLAKGMEPAARPEAPGAVRNESDPQGQR